MLRELLKRYKSSLSPKVLDTEFEEAIKVIEQKNTDQLAEIENLQETLRAIHTIAHDKSTGPTIPDVYWDIRSLAGSVL